MNALDFLNNYKVIKVLLISMFLNTPQNAKAFIKTHQQKCVFRAVGIVVLFVQMMEKLIETA